MTLPKRDKPTKATAKQIDYLYYILDSYAIEPRLLYNKLTKDEASTILSIIEPIYKEHKRCKLINFDENYHDYYEDDFYEDIR